MGPIKASEKKKHVTVLTATDHKEQGNKCFAQRRYAEALACYTKAINVNPNVATYYTNRSLCHLKLKQWQLACQDCRMALELDPCLVKAHFFTGQALLELKQFDEAITSLMRASDLAREQQLNFGDDITGLLRIARKHKWMTAEEKCIREERELKSCLTKLLEGEKARQKDNALARGDIKDLEEELQKLDILYEEKLDQLNSLFHKLDEKRKKREVPDILCGKISFELMRDPVITPSGITYDRRDIDEHLQRVGHFDPVTRMHLTQDQLVPNLAMKEVIDNYLDENPWAEDY